MITKHDRNDIILADCMDPLTGHPITAVNFPLLRNSKTIIYSARDDIWRVCYHREADHAEDEPDVLKVLTAICRYLNRPVTTDYAGHIYTVMGDNDNA